jgi:hypothetical protein
VGVSNDPEFCRLNAHRFALRKMLTRQLRRMVCVHEAAHAVVYALGGSRAQGLAVAPTGSESWSHLTQRGVLMKDLWGACELPDGLLLSGYFSWDDEQLCYRADRDEFVAAHRFVAAELGSTQRRQLLAELRRFVRLRVCATLAGPIADDWRRLIQIDRRRALCPAQLG